MTKLLTQSEAADFLQLTPRQVLRLANRGELPRVVFPNHEVRFDQDDLARWIESHKRPAVKVNGLTSAAIANREAEQARIQGGKEGDCDG